VLFYNYTTIYIPAEAVSHNYTTSNLLIALFFFALSLSLLLKIDKHLRSSMLSILEGRAPPPFCWVELLFVEALKTVS
jgi:hypothetical protein